MPVMLFACQAPTSNHPSHQLVSTTSTPCWEAEGGVLPLCIYADVRSPLWRRWYYNRLRSSLREIRSHEDKWPFTDPVNPVQVPDYYDVVKDPVDLKLINERIKEKCVTACCMPDMFLTKDRYFSVISSFFLVCCFLRGLKPRLQHAHARGRAL